MRLELTSSAALVLGMCRMPRYDYRCDRCVITFEVEQSIHAKPLSRCKTCRCKLTKLIAPVGIAFNGSGFYSTGG